MWQYLNKRWIVQLLALVCLPLLFVGGPGPYSSRAFIYVWGLGHLFCFALWSWLYWHWRSQAGYRRRMTEVLLLTLLFGGAIELLQGLQLVEGREASWVDLGNDLLGSLLLLVFLPQLSAALKFWQRWLLRLPVLLLVGWVVLPFLRVTGDELIARQQFPLLSGFETPFELSRWGGNSSRYLSRSIVAEGKAALRVELNTDRYSGVALKYFPADWRGYRVLALQLYNPQTEPLPLYCRIHDQDHAANGNRYSDRYNSSLLLGPGWNRIEVPLAKVARAPKGRLLDLSRVAGVILFVGKLEAPKTFYLDDVRLLR